MGRLVTVVWFGIAGMLLWPVSARAHGDEEGSTSLARLAASADLIGVAEVQNAEFFRSCGLISLRVIDLWHEHRSVRPYWGGEELVIATTESLTVGQQVVFFAMYAHGPATFFAALGTISGQAVKSHSPTLADLRLETLREITARQMQHSPTVEGPPLEVWEQARDSE